MIPLVEKAPRTFVDSKLSIEKWDDLKPFFDQLLERELPNLEALKDWLSDLSELEAVLEEDAAWRYIRMTVDTGDQAAAENYQRFVSEIQPMMAPYADQLNKRFAKHPEAHQLVDKAYQMYLERTDAAIALFREANIPLQTELQSLAQRYSGIIGKIAIELDGKQLTLPAAGAKLQETDRGLREEVYRKMQAALATEANEINSVFEEMLQLRHQLALNADHPDFRSYKFAELNRFDYTAEDCEAFHESIEQAIVPLTRKALEERRMRMGLEVLRPWDLSVDPEGRAPLQPFQTAEELLQKSIVVFERIDPFFADCLRSMEVLGHLDLASKAGKAPGGYNYPLYESGLPFIFMNAVGTQRDLVTMMHEGGHAVHSVLSHSLELTAFKSCPSEVAELASMSMELISMDHWEVFYADPEACIRAKREHLEDILSALPWIARIDAFQHWLYTNPGHTREEREDAWIGLDARLGSGMVDFTGFETARKNTWHRQLHLFEVPFYYIEYAMAQLGAIAVWRNYKTRPQQALEDFKAALSLGYKAPIQDIYATAGVRFDFSAEYLVELAEFLKDQLAELS